MVAATRLTSKGQVTIPKEVREQLGLRPGDEIEFVKEGTAFHVRKRVGTSPFGEYRGYLSHLAGQDPDKLVEEMRGR